MAMFTSNKHGNPKLLDTLGYSYNKHSNQYAKFAGQWTCSKLRTKERCMARVTTEGNFIVKHVGEHNHLA